ncbi:MAG: FkbM family methyltransferase [Candidatus Lokiarchaeota archaeon]|nr:FkbM family methyltransferase [Candidatus Lokiarchaeota archaeon]
MKKICIYVGGNIGSGLMQYINQFDEIHVFEPDPELFEILKDNCLKSNNYNCDIILNNSACYLNNGTHNLYITENRVSTSLGDVDISTFDSIGHHSGGKPPIKIIEIETVNLHDYLQDNEIEEVDLLLTDAQGADFTILTTVRPYIEQKKIKKFFCETHNNGKSLYLELDNSFDNFKNLLSENYKIEYYSFDGQYKPNDYEIKENDIEWDTIWELK